jgi:hypothetical protein
MYENLQAAFDAHPVQPNANAKGCTIWLGNTMGNGPYGKLHFGGKVIGAHRAAWELAHGRSVPAGHRVDHRCHVTLCVNPAHLRLATQKQNQEHRKGANRNSHTGLRGITYDHHRGQFRVRLKHSYAEIHVGRFDTLEDAISASVRARNEHFTHNDRDKGR